MNKRTVYLDYNATTPLHPEVKKSMEQAFELYANPSSMHEFGRTVRNRLEYVRQNIADFIGALADEIIFTGGGSESNNTVLKMVSCPLCSSKNIWNGRTEIITSKIEHPSMINTAQHLQSMGQKVHFIKVDQTGKVDLNHFTDTLNERTALVSIILANNEIGTIQNIKEISALVHKAGALMHTDAVQGIGKLKVDVGELDVDYLSFSAHKFYGPKGVGILYVKRTKPFYSLIHGGHQESGRRAGTMNSLAIMGMGKAVEMIKTEMNDINNIIARLKEKLKTGIEDLVPDVHYNGHPEDSLCNTLNVSFKGAEGEAILLYLDLAGIGVSTGSACSSGTLEPSHVLLATGIGPELAHGSIRFSLGRETTEEDINYVLDRLPSVIKQVRSMSTVYSGECR